MPSLKDVNCVIELSESQHPLQEFGTIYGDGFVETFVPVPDKPQSFSIHLTSNSFIAPGVAIFVYVDGVYQCNRNRQDLKLRKPSDSRSLVDFRVRQKEEGQKDGSMIAREWTFDKLNIASADDAPNLCSPDILENIGCIEVLVLRCAGSRNAKSASTINFDGAGDRPSYYFGLDQNTSPSNEKSMYDDRGPYFKDPGCGFRPPPPLSSYRAPYAESMHSHEGSASRSRHVSQNARDASPRASIARHSNPISRYSEAISPGARRTSNLPLPGFHYGSGPIPSDGEPLQNRQSGAVAQDTPSIDPVWLNKLLTTVVKQGVEESRRVGEQSEGHAKRWKRNSEKKAKSQAPGAWPESPLPASVLVYDGFEKTPSSVLNNHTQHGSMWNRPQDGWSQSEATSRTDTRMNWGKKPVWETKSSNGDGWSSREELPSDSWDTQDTWATNKAYVWEASSRPASPIATMYFNAQPISLAPSHTHDRWRRQRSSKKRQSRSKSRTRHSRRDYEITSSSSEDKDYIHLEPPSDSVVSLSSSNVTHRSSHFRNQRQNLQRRSKIHSRRSNYAKSDSDQIPSRRSRHTSTLQPAPVETTPAPSVVARMTPTIMNAPVQMAPSQPQTQQPSVSKDTTVANNITVAPYISWKTGFAQDSWRVNKKRTRSASTSTWDSGKKSSTAKNEWEETTVRRDDRGTANNAGWEKAEPGSYNKSGWDTTDDDEAGGWYKDGYCKEGEAMGWGTKDVGWGVADMPKKEEKMEAADDWSGLKNILEDAFSKNPQATDTPPWQGQTWAIQGDDSKTPGVQCTTPIRPPVATPTEKPNPRRHSNKTLSKYRNLRPGPSSAPILNPHWQFPPPPSSTKPLHPMSEDQIYTAPKAPRYTIDQATASEKCIQHQVRAGQATEYGHAVGRPEYLDSLNKPYAVFRFKYRSPEVLGALFGDEAKAKAKKDSHAHVRQAAKEKLKALPQEALIVKMMALQSKLAEATAGEKKINSHGGDRHKHNHDRRSSSHHTEKKNDGDDDDTEKKKRPIAQTDQLATNWTELWVKRHMRHPSK